MAIEFEEAGRQTAEPAVAQTCVGLLVKNFPPLVSVLVEGLPDHRIEHEVHDVVAERAADEKLDRDVVDPLRILACIGFVRAQPAVGKSVSHRAGGGFVAFARIGGLRLDDVVELQVPIIERVRPSGEANRADAVAPQEFVAVQRSLLRLVENLSVAFHCSAPVFLIFLFGAATVTACAVVGAHVVGGSFPCVTCGGDNDSSLAKILGRVSS